MGGFREKIRAEQIPNGLLTWRMFADSITNFVAPGNTLQNGRVLLNANEKQQIDFKPSFRAKPIFRLWGHAIDDENYENKPMLHELTNEYFIISSDINQIALYQASEAATEYTVGSIVP